MPRHARLILPNIPLHIVARGNNRQTCFFQDDDYVNYRHWLGKFALENHVHIHAYVLMSNHVHLLASCAQATGYASMMKAVSQQYTQYINRTYQRSGTLWEGRFKSCVVQNETYVLNCYRYIEQNPVRAHMVEHVKDYPWSSYHCNVLGQADGICTPHPMYTALGKDPSTRQRAYEMLVNLSLDTAHLSTLRQATLSNFVAGNQHLLDHARAHVGRNVSPGVAGRPKKPAAQ